MNSTDESTERDQQYVKADLEDYADLDAIEDDEETWSSPTREEILQQSLEVSDDEIGIVNGGGYQGSMLFIFEKADYLWVVQDEYGSCSGCDGLLAADHAKEYATTLMRNAYAFTDPCDARPFLEKRSDQGTKARTFSVGWSPVVEGGLDILEEKYGC